MRIPECAQMEAQRGGMLMAGLRSGYAMGVGILAAVFLAGCLPLPPEPSAPEPAGRRLRAIVADKYADGSIIIGATTGSWAFEFPTGKILDREFSYVTPENDFKQDSIHPDNSSAWHWAQADAWIGHIAARRLGLRVDGIGWQAYVETGWETPAHLEVLRALIDCAAERSGVPCNRGQFLDLFRPRRAGSGGVSPNLPGHHRYPAGKMLDRQSRAGTPGMWMTLLDGIRNGTRRSSTGNTGLNQLIMPYRRPSRANRFTAAMCGKCPDFHLLLGIGC